MRIRTIKPEFWTDKRVASWDHFTRLLFIGMWSAADDHGRGSAEPARLAAELFPYDLSRNTRDTLARVTEGIKTLHSEGRITLYAVHDEHFFEISNWEKHQKVDRPGKSRIPGPTSEFANASRDSRETPEEKHRLEQGTGNREQGTGNREHGAASPTPPADAAGEQKPKARFTPPTRAELDLEAAKLALPESQVTLFVSYYASNGWKVGRNPMRSWQHALAGWAARWREKEGQLAIGAHHAHHAPRNPLDTSSDPNAKF